MIVEDTIRGMEAVCLSEISGDGELEQLGYSVWRDGMEWCVLGLWGRHVVSEEF